MVNALIKIMALITTADRNGVAKCNANGATFV